MDLSSLTEQDRMKMLQLLSEKQMKDTMRLYNSLVERCFTDCALDFTTRSLTSKEEQCINKCADKFFRHSARVGQRFQEQQVILMQQQQQGDQPAAAQQQQ
eukprot:Unigene8584_Nuclearia_a/m.26286 Unigene8584_Nuclearia_a/g.26286  ORF Unigene8584_Nuclearia_a/g.26286 Unigene8584_Nuclearia_a/m.26286 type:complete len:101 (+) Unigene8584_Nuclearia_a:27-329(+)